MYKKRYTFHFILHIIIADKILTFKDTEARDRNQQNVQKLHISGFCIFLKKFS